MSKLVPLSPAIAGALLRGQTARMVPAVEVPAVFTRDECLRIIALRDTLGFDDAKIESRAQDAGGTAREVDREVRVTERTHLLPSPQTKWVFERMSDVVTRVNAETWQFRISAMEPIQLLTYPVGGHYGLHADLGTRGVMSLRKVSITVQLSDEADYDGGRLEIRNGGLTIVPERPQGSAVLFPSYQPHRVTPVTRGVRHALVLWVVGKKPLR